jgi:hypothetical protein
LLVGEPFQGSTTINVLLPWLSLRSNHGLKLANAFGVIKRRMPLVPSGGRVFSGSVVAALSVNSQEVTKDQSKDPE